MSVLTTVEPIAIVSAGCVFPGASSLDEFWHLIECAADTNQPVPAGRWLLEPKSILDPREVAPDRVFSERGCFIENFLLDRDGLELPVGLIEALDPSFHLVLAAGRDAWAAARTEGIARERVGVVLGNIALPTEACSRVCEELLRPLWETGITTNSFQWPDAGPAALNRYVCALPAGILARALGLCGGTWTLDAACASSLYALKLACDELQSGRADAMLAGGLSRPDSLYTQMGFCQLRALSRNGRCAPFDETGDGLVVGEGAGVFVLKRLADARRDGDDIQALIRGIGLSTDIEGNLLSPSSEGQLRALRQAYAQAGWAPNEVDLIECHATGTSVGDAVEFASLTRLWQDCRWQPGQCVLGAVKANIGHLLTAAGSSSLIKLLLAFKHQTLPPTANFSRPAAKIPLAGSPFRILTKGEPWPRRDSRTPRRAALNGFGFGGINAHVLLEEWNEPARATAPGLELRTENQLAAEASAPGDPIAIVGMAAKLGRWPNLRAFEQRILGGDDRGPAERSFWRGIPLRDPAMPVPCPPLPGYYLEDISLPVDRYRVPPRELAELLPQQALMLEVSRDALADGPKPADLNRMAVFIGLGLDLRTTDFHLHWSDLARNQESRSEGALTADRTLGALAGISASRIAKEFHFGGPSYTVSSEECSGVRALEIAVRALQSGELDQALAGAVDIAGDLRSLLAAAALGPFSPRGNCRPFDLDGDGTVPGEGAVAVVLKRLKDAQRDGDRIYSIIRGIGSSGGGPVGHQAFAREHYRHALERAYGDSGINPASVGYLESDSSGWIEQDQREARVLSAFFCCGTRADHCYLSSAKADFGHTGAASGLVAVVKASLALYRQMIPGLRGLHRPVPELLLVTTGPGELNGQLSIPPRLVAAQSAQRWARTPEAGPRRAGLTCLGVDGNVMHVLLEACETPPHPSDNGGPGSNHLAASAGPVERTSTQPKLCVIVPISGPPLRHQRKESVSTIAKTSSALVQQSSLGFMGDDFETECLAWMEKARAASARAHGAYLEFSRGLAETLALELEGGTKLSCPASLGGPPTQSLAGFREPVTVPLLPLRLDRQHCLEFARGSIAKVLGPDFRAVDSFPTRVRLPDEPLMLVDRILEVHGQSLSLGSGRLATEHDIHAGAWYLDTGRIPPCIAIEAGQADLFLSAFLGIDFQTRGRAVYRLLDATVRFHRPLPGPGVTIRYAISIEKFFRQANTWFFHFHFEATLDGQALLTMTDGCAGFFTNDELARGKGIARGKLESTTIPGKRAPDWQDFVPPAKCSLSSEQLDALRAGDFERSFGPAFATLRLDQPLTLPGGRMRLIHRIPELDSAGGRFGLGLVRGETEIHPEDWFLVCHFVDDRVMPGTLMFECCLHTLRVFLLRLGWIVEQNQVSLEPVPELAAQLKCRGQVVGTTRKVLYEVSIKELGFRPEPYVIADAEILADGSPIVAVTNLSLRYAGVTRQMLRQTWSSPVPSAKPALYDTDRILASARGIPSKAFGSAYQVFDAGRHMACLPAPPFLFLDRITAVHGKPFVLEAGGSAEAEYAIPADAWYFPANEPRAMSHAVLLETVLQPCGWLAAYLGSPLTSEEDLYFRNLGGTGCLHASVHPTTGILTSRVKLARVSHSAGMLLQWFDYEVRTGSRTVYEGNAYFGFFPKAALRRQEGLPEPPWVLPARAKVSDSSTRLPPESQFIPERLRMLDSIEIFQPSGGPHHLGFARATRRVHADDWFFKAHFHQDPVMPGSLGMEAFLHLVQFIGAQRWGDSEPIQWELATEGERHEWTFRGQILPDNQRFVVQAVVTEVNDETQCLRADGVISADGRVIYSFNQFTVRPQRSKAAV